MLEISKAVGPQRQTRMNIPAWLRQHIRPYSTADRAVLLEFQGEMFGPKAVQLDEAQFQWRFERNPFRPAYGPQILVCQKDGRVVGQQAGIPFELKVGDDYLRASWAIDLMVRPEWRLKGVGPALSETHVAENHITAALSVTEPAYKSYRRAGWTELGFIPQYVRPLEPSRMLKVRGGNHRLAGVAGSAIAGVLKVADAVAGAYLRQCGAVSHAVERFDEQVDTLWHAVAGHYPVIARRDLRALKWRFDAVPNPSRYRRLYLSHGGCLRGYAVLRACDLEGAPVGLIVDYLSAPDWQARLFAACAEHFRGKAIAVYCPTLDPFSRLSLRALGFVPRPTGTRFMLRVGPGAEGARATLARRENWFLTLADSDYEQTWS